MLDAPLSVDDHGTVAQVAPGPIAVQGVRFSYPGQSRPALHGVSFRLEPGLTLGLVGPTGAGKSTLLRLLLRHHAPAAGTLRWNGLDLQDYTLDALRGAIAWVPQEPFLFSASVAENIALARPQREP